MPRQPLFSGLVVDENGRPVEIAYVGEDPCYVVDDAGFRRHILSEKVDRQVLEMMRQQISGHEDQLSEQTAKMLGTDDIFSKAMIENQFKNIDQQFENVLKTGIPEDGRVYMGMVGFRVVINVHGDIMRVDQPTVTDDGEGGEE
jgi:hypothetical protein